jgi:hypothetical protein
LSDHDSLDDDSLDHDSLDDELIERVFIPGGNAALLA